MKASNSHYPAAALQQLQQRLGHQFVDSELLIQALTHRSAGREHNERLEFLGDAVLGFVVAARLYQRFASHSEGDLSRMRSALVNRDTLANVARELRVGDLLLLGAGERKSGGRERSSILCDAMEALLGAVYLDAGLPACELCIEKLFAERLDATQGKDAKTLLQERMQAHGVALPSYEVSSIEGDEHDQTFVVCCHVSLLPMTFSGRGKSRRQAEQQAAAATLRALEQE